MNGARTGAKEVEGWRREQDSNLRGLPPTVFKTAALNRSAIPPRGMMRPLYRWCRRIMPPPENHRSAFMER